jgi:hypothetical protein
MCLRASCSTGLLVPLAPCSGMPESLAPWCVTLGIYPTRFLSTGQSLPLVNSSLSIHSLVPLAPCSGMPELPVPHWGLSVQLYVGVSLFGSSFEFFLSIFFNLVGLHFSLTSTVARMITIHRGSLATLWSSPQCHTVLGMIPWGQWTRALLAVPWC